MEPSATTTVYLAANPRAAHRIAAGQLAARAASIAATMAAEPTIDDAQWQDPLALLGRPSRAWLSIETAAA